MLWQCSLTAPTKEEGVVFERAYAELRLQVILREICCNVMNTEEEPWERDELAHCMEVAREKARPAQLMPIVIGSRGHVDAFECFRVGKMYSTIVQSPIKDGILAINTITGIMDGKEVAERLPIPPTVVTQEDVETVKPDF